MACLGARMTAQRLELSTGLLARLGGVFALTTSMTVSLAEMRTAFQALTADLTAARICKPARYVFQYPLAAQTFLFG